MKTQKKVAFFARSLDFIFRNDKDFCFVPILRKDSEEERIVKEELKFEEIIAIEEDRSLEMENCEILEKTILFDLLKKEKIKILLFTKPYFKKGVKILPSYSKGAEKFENKIFFEKFLRKYGLSKESKIFLRFPRKLPFHINVIQLPNSTGGEKTFIVKSKEDFEKIKGEIAPPFLVRKFYEGLPLGVTFFIGKNIYFSALDRQCFGASLDQKIGIFKGIQWLPFDFFPKKIYQKIEENLRRISASLKREGFRGWINIDFIVNKKGEVFFLEANPRFTLATPQILSFLEITGGIDFFKLITSEKEISGKAQKLPRSRYEGSAFYLKSQKEMKVEKIREGGFFKVETPNNSIKKLSLSQRFKFLEIKNGIFFYNELKKGDCFTKELETGTIISNFPVFDFESGKLLKIGKKIVNFFEKK